MAESDAKVDEEQEVRDEDADTRDLSQENEQTQQDIKEQSGDIAEVNRKIDGLLDAVGILGKQVAQLSRDYGAGAPATVQPDMTKEREDPGEDLEDMDFSI